MKKQLGKAFAILLSLVLVLSSFSGRLLTSAAEFADTSGYESLAEIYKDYFKMGAACEAVSHWGSYTANKEIGNANKEALISGVFNSITCGNELKPAYNFDPSSETLFKVDRSGEEMLNWAKDNGIGMRFHVLVWHSQVDARFFAKDYKATSNGVATNDGQQELDEECLTDRETLINRLRTYIYGAIEYLYKQGYAQTVYAMDVVNEAVDEGKDDGLRRSYWYKIIGPEFLYYAFLFAREAEVKYSKEYAGLYGLDPNGDLSSIQPKLFYNDYNEWFSRRVNITVDFITNRPWNADQQMIKSDVIKPDGDGTMKGDGIIDGIGMQGHLSDNNNIEEYMAALRAYSDAVDEVHITELDVGVTRTGENRWYYQAKFFYDFFSALINEVKNGAKLTSVTIWGLTDDQSWRDGAYPLLFTGDLSAKSAYYAVAAAGKGEEFNMSIAETITDLKDRSVDFEPYKDANGGTVNYTPESAGFMMRGTGHMPVLRLIAKINHTEGAKMGYSLLCEREEQDATCKYSIASYSGKNVTFTAYVMTDDSEITIGLDTGDSTPLKTVASKKGEWTPVSVNVDIPEKLDSAFIYFETNGKEKMYIDDVSVIYTKDGEEPAPVIGDDDITAKDDASTGNPETADSKNDDTAAEPTAVPASNENTTANNDTNSNSSSNNSEKSSTTTYIAIGLIVLGALLLGYAGVLIAVNKNK